MLLKMNTSLAGPALSLSPNDPYSPDDDAEALRLIDAGFATADDPKVEAAARKVAAAAAAEAEAAAKAAPDAPRA